MQTKRMIGMVLCATLLLSIVLPSGAAAEDYVAKKGIANYHGDLSKLVEQTLALAATEKGQRSMLNRLFQMKFDEAEHLFAFCGDSEQVKRQIAELYLLKAIENQKAGNRIQAYFALLDAGTWDKQAKTRSMKIGNTYFDMAQYTAKMEAEMRERGNNVRFLIATFPEGQVYHPDKVVMARDDEEGPEKLASGEAVNRAEKWNRTSSLRTEDRRGRSRDMTEEDEAFLLARFRKALYAYYYDPIEANAEFSLYLPFGNYYVYEKEFAIRPEEFRVTAQETKVNLQPAQWFRLQFTEEVHPSNITLSFHGVEWKDLQHVPFGRFRIKVNSSNYTYPVVRVAFVEKDDTETLNLVRKPEKPEATVVVADRGTCKLKLRERDSNEKLRYSFLGY